MRVAVLRSFAFSRDGVTSERAVADTEADIPNDLVAGLAAAGYVAVIAEPMPELMLGGEPPIIDEPPPELMLGGEPPIMDEPPPELMLGGEPPIIDEPPPARRRRA